MKTIVINLNNFSLIKLAYILENNKVINVEETTSLDSNTINYLATKYNPSTIELIGNKEYVTGLIRNIQEEMNTKFNKNIELKYKEI